MKSNIKAKKYYNEAESLQKGWGKYLLWIDKLKDKKGRNGKFTTNQFCWTLYGDGYCSTTWELFKQYAIDNKIKCIRYTLWREIFKEWNLNEQRNKI